METANSDTIISPMMQKIIEFCSQPRSRSEIAWYLGIETESYVVRKYLTPLINKGLLRQTLPEAPRSKKQMYVSKQNVKYYRI